MSSKDTKSSDGSSNSAIDRDLIKDLAGLLNETDLTEIEVETDGLRVRVARNITMQQVSVGAPIAATAPAAVAAAPIEAARSEAADLSAHPGAVTSPMVGTAYTAPEPGAAPFVLEGDKVSAGQTLLIVEAMKTMNPIQASKSGTVTRIMVSDGQPVEYGEPLLLIE